MAEYLASILKELKISSRNDFDNLLRSGQEISSLKVVSIDNAKDVIGIEYDQEEGRIYKEKVEFEGCIIDLPKLNLRDSEEVSFVNCIVIGRVLFGAKDYKSILIDSCIFFDDTIIGMAGVKYDVCIYKANFTKLVLGSLEAITVYIADCRIGKFEIAESKINKFKAVGNSITHITVSQTVFENIFFPHGQIDFSNFRGKNRWRFFSKKKCLSYRNNLESFTPPNIFDFIEIKVDDFVDDIVYRNEKETLDFICNHTDIQNNRECLSDVTMNSSIYSQKNILLKFFMLLFGAFVKPSLIVMYGILVFLLYASIYAIPELSFSIGDNTTNIDFLNALYFSGITFTTIGYGDIAPTGIAKIISISEGILGIFLSSSFLVSLIRKYCD
ncbi:MAG: potassium channel family protein [Desulfurivibrionaceae bacterium]|jgi:hypothetical protein